LVAENLYLNSFFSCSGKSPSHLFKRSGVTTKHIMQQLERMNIVEFDTKERRKITSSGQRDFDQVVGRIMVID